jgi:hypothetical protein
VILTVIGNDQVGIEILCPSCQEPLDVWESSESLAMEVGHTPQDGCAFSTGFESGEALGAAISAGELAVHFLELPPAPWVPAGPRLRPSYLAGS